MGVNRDGLLHVSEGLDPRLAVGDTLPVFIKAVDAESKRLSLTTRDPAASRAAAAALAAAAEQRAAERKRVAEADRQRKQRERQLREAQEAERVAAQAEITRREQELVEQAMAREAAAAAARAAAGLVLSAVELVRGEQLPPAAPTPQPRKVLVRRCVRGKELVLYQMPWKA